MTPLTARIRRIARLAAAGALVTLAACASGESILNAGNDATTTTAPPTTSAAASGGSGADDDRPRRRCAAVRRRRSTSSAAAAAGAAPTTIDLLGRFGRRRLAAPAAAPPDIHPCPVDALDSADGPVHITFWHTMTNTLEDALVALTDDVQRQPGPGRRRAAEPERLQRGDRQVLPVEPGRPAGHRADARVHGAADGRHQLGDPGRRVHPDRGLRHHAVPATRAARSTRPAGSSGRCRSTCRARCSTTTARCSRRPASTRTSRRSRSTSCASTRRRSSMPARRPTASALDTGRRLRRRLVPRAVVRPTRRARTPTTTTGARPDRRRCTSTGPSRSSC